MRLHVYAASIAAACAMALGSASAQDIKLPGQIAWTAYDTGSSGYNQAVAIGGALKNELGVDLRVLPGKNDVSRNEPLRQGRVQFSATGVGASFMAQEGVFEFGEKRWGPQPIRVLVANNGNINLAVGVAGDIGVKTYADLKGKRVAWVRGAPALNVNVTAYLAFAGLTWDDVEKVEFGGFGDSWNAIINGQADAAFASTASGKVYELEASPRGIYWPPLPHDDKEGWARLKKVAPFFQPNMATVGAGMSKDNPYEGGAYPYPVLTTYASQDTDLTYNMTKAMVEMFPQYDGKAPGIGGWALDRQNFEWAVPYHDGAIRFFKEKGVWTDAAQAHNDRLIERQRVLAQAWEEAMTLDVADDKWEETWLKKRRMALEGAGFDPVF
ncbi:MAG: TAXI family TRAP transporter solute-binding subunit [Alphaproteobacteria bacterium]|nr:TAXI family TRAP transporter solute-binding subunit [Alphaproteobacteria bacterium]MDX5369902.1 TAXI family TRAP transporter solute-binding subunit [Alphaproteobacteria bacterium]MDX5464498.1 TAXI family TRAP transporter solute-binding subunit [Alphaproteobacteria bacterium]